jgi:nickel-dependent lactate racemase
MEIKIPYGKEEIEISINENYEILKPNKVQIQDQDKIIKEALDNPINFKPFKQFIKNSDKLLIIVNDATRPTPTKKVLKFLYPYISKHSNLKFLIATGVHRAPTIEEYKFIFGEFYEKFKDRIFSHDSRKKEDMEYLGKSKNNTEMYINKLVTEMKNVVVIGSVEPHYFAGYTGGRKSFLPGVASYETIEMNHKLALSDKACSLSLKNNPVNEDMIDAMNVLNKINVFSIQTVLTAEHDIYAVTAGDLIKSFDAAIDYANQVFCVTIKKKANIVISVAPFPMDIDLYQSQKALDNGNLALEDNGIIIIVSKCRDGIGEKQFLDLLSKAKTSKQVFEMLDVEYKLGYHKAAKMAQVGMRAEMWMVSDLDDNIIEKAKIKPYNSIQDALDNAINVIKSKRLKPFIIVMPSGSLTIPKLISE